MSSQDFQDWIGRTETVEDLIALAPVEAAAAMLDDSESRFTEGSLLPPLWHWFFFLAKTPHCKIGSDGHAKKGGFMPPIDLPRRMFAGARLKFLQPMVIGRPARRDAVIRSIAEKAGKTGRLAFVTVRNRFSQDGVLCIEEEQDIVYREAGGRVPSPVPVELLPPPAGAWVRTIVPDPVLLFRFSALTFNGHRIHYDRRYATEEEGYPGLVVQGPLTAVLLMELVRRNSDRRVSGYSFRGLAPLFDLQPFRITGAPAADAVALEGLAPDGRTAMTAAADLG
jgi:3-methylfumaryl-CoA hydratase